MYVIFCSFIFLSYKYTFRSAIHFELIFVTGIRFVSIFFFLCVDIQFSAPYVEKTVFPLLYFFSSFVKDPFCLFIQICFWALLSCFIDLYVISFPHCFDDCNVVESLELGSVNPSTLFYSFRMTLYILGLLLLHIILILILKNRENSYKT